MQISTQIDKLIQALNELKPHLTDNNNENFEKFSSVLEKSLSQPSAISQTIENSVVSTELEVSNTNNQSTNIPAWVNSDIGYDPENPRKPNMREFMEAISGKTMEDLYAEPFENYLKINRQAADMLYGVVGSNLDTRDWSVIMSADNILEAARKETGKMYSPEINIKSEFDNEDKLTNQIAILKDKNGNTLRMLSKNISSAEQTLKNFGVTNASIPANLDSKVVDEKFDKNLLKLLKNFNTETSHINETLIQSTTEAISKKIVDEIPLDEYEKL